MHWFPPRHPILKLSTDFHISAEFDLTPNGNPKYVEGRLSILQLIAFAHPSRICWFELIPKRQFFWKLTLSPNITWKHCNVLLTFINWTWFASQKMIVSSAYWRWDTIVPPLPTLIPQKRSLPTAPWRIELKALTTKLNKKGDNGHPCHKPLLVWNWRDGAPLTKTNNKTVETQVHIHFLHFSPKFIFSITISRDGHLTLSYAFSKSTFNNNPPKTRFFLLCL